MLLKLSIGQYQQRDKFYSTKQRQYSSRHGVQPAVSSQVPAVVVDVGRGELRPARAHARRGAQRALPVRQALAEGGAGQEGQESLSACSCSNLIVGSWRILSLNRQSTKGIFSTILSMHPEI